MDPQDSRPLSNLAAIYFERAQYAECSNFCERALPLIDIESQASLAEKTRIRLAKSSLFSRNIENAKTTVLEVTSEESRKALQASLSRIPDPCLNKDQPVMRKELLDRIGACKPAL